MTQIAAKAGAASCGKAGRRVPRTAPSAPAQREWGKPVVFGAVREAQRAAVLLREDAGKASGYEDVQPFGERLVASGRPWYDRGVALFGAARAGAPQRGVDR